MAPVVLAALAVALGTGAGHGRPGLALPLSAAAIALLGASLLLRRRAVWLVLIALCAAAGASAAVRAAAASDAVLPKLSGSGVVEVCGTVRTLRPRSVEMRADTVEKRSTSWRTSEPVRVTGRHASRDLTKVRPGERICAKGEVVPPRDDRTESPLVVAEAIGERATASRVRLAAAALRARFSDAARAALPRTQAGLLLGMTDGDVALLDEETVEAFRTTGLAHLVAVSGSNVAVLLAVVLLVARRASRRRWMHVVLALPALWFFAFLTGLEASVLRAVVTAAIALFVTLEGRASDGVRLAAFAFVVLVLASPELLFHPGFQLSFAATLGLILWARPLTDRIANGLPGSRASGVVAAFVGTTIAAQSAAAPLLAWHFGAIPALGGIANLVVAPLAPVVMIGGIVTLSAASGVPQLAWMPLLMRLPLDVILWCARFFARLPLANVDASALAGLALTAVLVAMCASSRRARVGAVAVALVAASAATGASAAGADCQGRPSVVALDVGQGTAVLLRTGANAVLVDGGPEAGDVVEDLDEQGVSDLDAVFVSHPHADHTQGVVDVIDELGVGRVIGPVTIGWGTGASVVRAAKHARVPVIQTAAGDVHRFGAITLEVVFPQADPDPLNVEENVHANSLVLRAQLGGVTVILPGDVGAEEEKDLLDPAEVGGAILVAPHHGSKDLDPAFVEAVDPRLVLVTVGEDNRYGHPAPEAMRTYAANARVFRTDRNGVVAVCLGDELEVKVEKP